MSIFETATREKLRVQTDKGSLTVEQLWDLALTSLNSIAVGIDEEISKLATKSFLPTKLETPTTMKRKANLELQLEVLKHILTTKLTEAEVAKAASDKAEQKRRLTEALAAKQEGKLATMSEEELKAAIAAL